jgi:signal transduction histidine kinase
MLKKIRTFLGGGLIPTIIVLLILNLFILSFYIQSQDESKCISQSNKTTFLLAGLLINASQVTSPEELATSLNALKNDKFIFNNHRIIITIDKRPNFPTQFATQDSWQTVHHTLESNKEHQFSYLFKNGTWVNYSEMHIYHAHEFATMLILAELIIIGSILFYSFSLQRLSIPLRKFKKTAERLGRDINTKPAQEHGPKLVRETASVMNKMQNRITNLIQTRTQMLAAISHDLRTPITRLKLRAQFISQDNYAKKIVEDLDEMEKMIDGILSFAREDNMQEKKVVFDFNSLLTSICEDFIDQNKPVHITTDEKQKPFLGSPLAIKRAISNIIQNALKYAGEVWVTFDYLYDQVVVMIEDNGPGIPEDALSKVFQPFYRVQNPDANSTGVGLGLTIAHEVVHAHSGSITLKNRPEKGLCVTLTFPIEADQT